MEHNRDTSKQDDEINGSDKEMMENRETEEYNMDTIGHISNMMEDAVNRVGQTSDKSQQMEWTPDTMEQKEGTIQQREGVMELDNSTVLSYLECPVCILPPRTSPIYQCPTGHLVCCECQPSLSRCPICNVRFRKILTRDFFAEKLLELLERKCRFEVDGCDFISKVSVDLVEHERNCPWKQSLPVRRRRRKESSSNQDDTDNGGDGDEMEEGDNDEDEALEEDLLDDDDEDEDDVIEVEDVFVSNFAFIVVLLRAYMLEFAKYDPSDSDNFFFEYFLLFLLCVWLYHVWQENGFHILLDETSPYIAGWFAATVLGLMLLKSMYLGPVGEGGAEQSEAVYRGVMGTVKPAVTLATGLFCCAIHAYVYDLREESWFVLGCVMVISVILSGLEAVWDLQAQMDLFYYIIFWLQSFFIVLPFGMIGRHFLEF